MNKLKLFARKALILAMALLEALFETLVIAVGIVLVGALATVVLPIVSWVGTAVAAKAKLKMIR